MTGKSQRQPTASMLKPHSTDSHEIIREFNDVILKEDITENIDGDVMLTGYLVKLEYFSDALSTSQISSTIISLIVSFFVLLVLTRRFAPSFMSSCQLLCRCMGSWFYGSSRNPLNVLTVMITALTIGLGIDYSIHMWKRFETLVDREVPPWRPSESPTLPPARLV